MTRHGAMMGMVAGAAAMAIAGCTFGDEPPPQEAKPVIGPWFEQNCVPEECLYQCCHGWKWRPEPSLRGGNVPGAECEKVRQRIPSYSEYVFLMGLEQNYCSGDFASLESGDCRVVRPLNVIEGFSLDGEIVYSELGFLTCEPKGQPLAYPMEDVELIRQE
jgi:hypothetical protein